MEGDDKVCLAEKQPAELRHDLPEDGRCPRCQEILDACTGIGHDATPKPGDLSVCSPCGAVLAFTGDLSFRLMTDAEIAALDDETLLALLDGIEGACGLERAFAAVRSMRPNVE